MIHVLDASRAVTVVSSLLDPTQRADYAADIADEYADLRREHYDGLKDRRYLSLEAARAKRLHIDFARQPAPVRPSFVGTKVLKEFNLAELLPYIDWSPFFSVWQLRGKYPNRGYPKIFNDATVGTLRRVRDSRGPRDPGLTHGPRRERGGTPRTARRALPPPR